MITAAAPTDCAGILCRISLTVIAPNRESYYGIELGDFWEWVVRKNL